MLAEALAGTPAEAQTVALAGALAEAQTEALAEALAGALAEAQTECQELSAPIVVFWIYVDIFMIASIAFWFASITHYIVKWQFLHASITPVIGVSLRR